MIPSLKHCGQFLISCIVTFVIASIVHSQFVLLELSQIGIEISIIARLSMTIDDLLGLLPTYGSVIALSLLFSLGLSSLVIKRYPTYARFLYPASGAIGISAALLAMHPILDIYLIAGARSQAGFIGQCLAGAIGGWAFYALSKHSRDSINSPSR